ncbi:hypothetical protein QBC39DRAFT_382388 [Podospora conica]|nr:hypothetical protein QBC39DRAFT_382388 [Schizothecium conicum]
MSRFAHLDTDAERLPPGMQRVAYDADTQTYHYTDNSAGGGGAHYVGAPGARYGSLRRVPVPDQRDANSQPSNPFAQPPPPKYQPAANPPERMHRRSAPPPPRKNQTFDDILGPAVPDIDEEASHSGGGLRRLNSVSKAAGNLVRRAATVKGRPARRMDLERGEGGNMGGYKPAERKEMLVEEDERRFDEKSSFPPLPPRPESRPKRAHTVTGLARGLKKGVKQMFDESESEFKARRG